MKVCSKCNTEKSLEEFYFRDKARGIRRAECKECSIERTRANYRDAKDMVNEIKTTLGCAKCGEARFYLLEFHHIDPSEKSDTVARLVHSSCNIEKVQAEIEKCVCLCANCHREYHYLEDNKHISSIEDYI